MNQGIFETIAVHHGYPVFLDTHLNRLEYAADNSGIDISFERKMLISEICSRSKGKDNIALKVVLNKDGIHFSERDNPYLHCNYHGGADICLSRQRIDETDPRYYFKSTERALFNEEKKKAANMGFEEVIFTNQKGYITEGAVSNIFCVKHGEIFTPKVSSGLLDGIIRRFLIGIHGGAIKETFVTPKDLFEAEEIFLTNSLMGIMPVRSLDGKRYLTGGKGSKLSDYYKFMIQTLSHS